MKRVAFVVVLLLTLGLSQTLLAQELASLTGVVTDKTGAVVPDVAVKLTDTKTNATYQATTNATGGYDFVKLLPGPGYVLVFTKDGFDTLTISNVYIGVGSTHTQNAQLQLGKVTETVEVSGQGDVVSLDTTDTVIGKTFDMRNVHDLPIQARESPLALLDQLPGVVDTTATSDPNSSRAGAVTGSRTDQANVTLDGLDVNDFATGQSFIAVGDAPVDSVQEFRVETANPLSASGRGSGAQVELVTKGGTNNWHGAVFDYLRNTVTEANTFFNDLNDIAKPKLIRNSFGANLGGPILKDKLFFFFDYEGRRDAREDTVEATVPLDSFRAGNISYINSGSGCDINSRINTTPNCVTTLTPAQAQMLDPAGIGLSPSLLSFINGRFPHANDLSVGDGLNTGGFRFNSPVGRSVNDYVSRVDYNISDKMKLFGRVSILRDRGGDDVNFAAPIQFPGDPLTHEIDDTSYAYVIGHTWTISPTKVNQFFYGETRSQLNFPTDFNPTGTNYFIGFGPISTPFSNPQSQRRVIPIPVFRDDFTYIHGAHNIQMGGTFKPIISNSTQVNDFNQVTVGLGGNLTSLDVRPTDILIQTNDDPTGPDPKHLALQLWDSDFAFGLGRIANINTNVNNGRDLQPLPLGTGHTRRYRYYETELYLQDSWKMRSDLTMTYGLRYQYYSVPYETNGLEATQNLSLPQFLDPRVQQGPQGALGPFPTTIYDLAGKANHGPGLYHPNWRDFAPRLAFSYNPSSNNSFLGRLLGDRKTVIRGGAGIVDDHTAINAVNFIQDQVSYLFQNSGATTPAGNLATDPRFIDQNTLPPLDPIQPVTRPFAPFFIPGLGGIGSALGQANYAVDPNLKTPYSITLSFGIQRELPGNFMLEANYFGRLGRRLITQADAGQVINFKDPATGHTLAGDWADLSKQIRAGLDPQTQNAVPEPFFESQMGPGGTQDVALDEETLLSRGDLGDALTNLAFDFLTNDPFDPGLAPGIGLSPQFGTDAYITNKGYSSYNGLLMTLHKRMSHNLQFDMNYTFSHSIDNISAPTSNVFGTRNFSGGLICDVIVLSRCKGNSDFDVRHNISTNAIWDVPVGRGQHFASTASGWENQVIGGWQISLLQNWNSGFAFTTVSNAFPISFSNNAPAVFDGDTAAIKKNVHFDPNTGTVQLFANPTKALGAFRGPLGLEGGTRNNLRGPSFSNFDIGLAKHFPIHERLNVTFRADAFNAFNHPNFDLPGAGGSGGTADITDPQFGVITTTAPPRQIQFSLRAEF